MKIFWHSDWEVYDLSIRSRLLLAFEDIVVPGDAAGYYPHQKLNRPEVAPNMGEMYAKYEFFPSDARKAKPFYPGEGRSYDWAYENFGERFAEAQYERVRVQNQKFDRYIQTAVLNEGVLIGDSELSDSDFNLWLPSITSTSSTPRLLGAAQALLSLAGIHIALPDISPAHIDELLEVKRKFPEEIRDYQSYVAELLSGSWDVIKSDPKMEDLIRWADFTAATKVEPSLRRLESAVRTGDRVLLQRIGYGVLNEVPNIVAGQLHGPNLSLVTSGLEALLRILAPNLAQSIRERKALESSFGLSYLYRLRKTLANMG